MKKILFYKILFGIKILLYLLISLSVCQAQNNGIQFARPTQVSGVAPISVTNNTVISIPQANAVTDGYLSSTDWTTFNGKLSPASAATIYVPYSGATGSVNIGANTFSNSCISFSTNGIVITNSTAVTSTANGASWYNQGGTGFTFFSKDPTQNEDILHLTNNINTLAVYINTNTSCQLYTPTNTDIGFATNNAANQFIISKSGYVASAQNFYIGNLAVTPLAKLHLAAGNATLPAVQLSNQTTFTTGTAGTFWYTSPYFIYNGGVQTPSVNGNGTVSIYSSGTNTVVSGDGVTSIMNVPTGGSLSFRINNSAVGTANSTQWNFQNAINALSTATFAAATKFGAMVTIDRATQTAVTALSINGGSASVNAFQYNVDGTNSLVAMDARNSYSLALQLNDVTKLNLSSTGFKVGNGTANQSCAALEITSTTQGVLFPKVTTVQKNAIGSPTAGLVVYDTTLNKLCVYTGAAWETVTSL